MQLLKRQLEPRRYQESIFATASMKNTLVVLPTGLGKTMIAIMLALHRLQQHPNGKVLVLAPTKPLAQQHERSFGEFIELPEGQSALFTGALRPEKRHAQWEIARLIFATPQGLENDVLSGKCPLEDVCLLVVDEAHRATGDYAYVFLAKQYERLARNPRILALTASPGTDIQTIEEVCKNLFIEEIEVRSSGDSDVRPYVQELDIEWVEVDLPPPIVEIRKLLESCLSQRVAALRALGINLDPPGKRQLLMIQGELQGQIARGERSMESLKAVSVAAEALKISHAVEIAGTQGVGALQRYFSSVQEQSNKGLSKAVKNLVQDVQWKAARVKADSLADRNIEHPKLRELRKVVLRTTHAQRDAKIIVFTQYRDQGVTVLAAIEELGVSAKLFVGQAKKGTTGMSQKEQKTMLEEFSRGAFTCLVATSVAEEGLDIPKVDLVVFYEPVPSAIRTVQRRGRTGRGERGRVVVLMARGTADVGYKWSAHHKEKRMYRAIADVKRTFHLSPRENEQKTLLQQYFEGKREHATEQRAQLKVICDYREKGSPVMKSLVDAGISIELKQLAVGDFQLSDRVIVEYKRVPDFVDSMLDGRLLEQLKSLSQYTRPIIIVEGEEDLYSVRNVRAAAIRGMLSTIVVSYNVAVLQTRTPQETSGLLLSMAKREQLGGQDFQYHTAKPLSDDELQEYIVAAFPGIGSQLARPLLEHFKSIRNIVNASEEELKKVALIGEKKAKRIKELGEKEYKNGERSA
jgi:Fanconi anemia group M protein